MRFAATLQEVKLFKVKFRKYLKQIEARSHENSSHRNDISSLSETHNLGLDVLPRDFQWLDFYVCS